MEKSELALPAQAELIDGKKMGLLMTVAHLLRSCSGRVMVMVHSDVVLLVCTSCTNKSANARLLMAVRRMDSTTAASLSRRPLWRGAECVAPP